MKQRTAATGFGSFAPDSDRATAGDKVSGLLYGGFTMTRVHPGIETRIERLHGVEK